MPHGLFQLHVTYYNDLQIPFITEEIKRYSTMYYNRLIGHENSYVTELSNPLTLDATKTAMAL
jgi:hypothetical protein